MDTRERKNRKGIAGCFYYWRGLKGLFYCVGVVGIPPFEQPQPTPEHPDFRRVTEHVNFKKLPPEMRKLIEKELLLYDGVLKRCEDQLAAHGERRSRIDTIVALAELIIEQAGSVFPDD